MANWSKQFKQIDTINSGQEYTLNDYVTLDMVNAPLNNTQYLYDVLYTTNTGLIAKVNQNTTDIATNTANITSVTNNLNNLKDYSYTGGNTTYRGMITNGGSSIGLEVDRSKPNEYYYRYENKLLVSELYTDINITRYYGDDTDEIVYSFNFNQNGLTLTNSAGQTATLTVEKINQHLYRHDIQFSKTGGSSTSRFGVRFSLYLNDNSVLTSDTLKNYISSTNNNISATGYYIAPNSSDKKNVWGFDRGNNDNYLWNVIIDEGTSVTITDYYFSDDVTQIY